MTGLGREMHPPPEPRPLLACSRRCSVGARHGMARQGRPLGAIQASCQVEEVANTFVTGCRPSVLGCLSVGGCRRASKQTPVDWDAALAWEGYVRSDMPLHHCTAVQMEGRKGWRIAPRECCCVLKRTATRNGTMDAWADTSLLDWGRVGGGHGGKRERQRRGR